MVTTLPDGEVLNILGDGRPPIEVWLNDPEGECVPAAEVGLDWATPPKYPDSIARIPNKSPSSNILEFGSTFFPFFPAASTAASAS